MNKSNSTTETIPKFLVDPIEIKTNIINAFLNAKSKIYISTQYLDFYSNLSTISSFAQDPKRDQDNKNKDRSYDYDYTFLQFLEDLCEKNSNLMINILVSETGLINRPQLPTKCFVTIIKNFGPKIKDELLAYTPSVEKILKSKLTKSGDAGDNNNNNNTDINIDEDKMMIEQIKDFEIFINKNIFTYNSSYLMIDDTILLFGDLNRCLFNSNHSNNNNNVNSNYNSWMFISRPTPNFIKFCGYNWEYKGIVPTNIWENEFIIMDYSNENEKENGNGNGNRNDINSIQKIKTASSLSANVDVVQLNKKLNNDNKITIVDKYGNEEIIELPVTQTQTQTQNQDHSEIGKIYNSIEKDKPDQKDKDFVKEEKFYCDLIGQPELEHDLICTWIEEAKEYIHIETPIFLSYATTKNQIANFIIRRLLFARKSWEIGVSDPFKCLICINSHLYGHCQDTNFEDKKYIHSKIKYTLDYIMSEIAKVGYDPYEFREMIQIISRFPQDNSHFNFNQTIIIQDGKNCLLTSSYICDRSLVDQNIELGMIIQNNKNFIQKIEYQLRVSKSNNNLNPNQECPLLSFDDFFNYMLNNMHGEKLSWPTLEIKQKFQQNDFILKILLGALYFC